MTYTAKDRAKRDAIRQIEGAYSNKRFRDASDFQKAAVRSGVLTPDQADEARETAVKPYIVRMAESVAKGDARDLIEAYRIGTRQERNALMPVIINLLDRKPELIKSFNAAKKETPQYAKP